MSEREIYRKKRVLTFPAFRDVRQRYKLVRGLRENAAVIIDKARISKEPEGCYASYTTTPQL